MLTEEHDASQHARVSAPARELGEPEFFDVPNKTSFSMQRVDIVYGIWRSCW